MATLGLVLSVVMIILSVLLCIIILLQSKRSAGLGAIGGGSGDTYWSKNKGSSMEGALERYTKIGGALFMILALVINLIG
ncbi:preprotein translocase subunit SecG [Anaerotignum sp.]|uniref:preprotein translocase subunit SecG n=1 Tax=Anaerotignum sp. TaxID=2039241 RepID=UPI0003364B53|nr:preprotein translocase subunit SecG [Anaerotignum sp.]MCI6055799.1 preprotein translocase subunit SecG [Clostridia bacterium]MDY3596457.1 preprotein translocase subunit SecG [Anaerotignum sp.]CDD62021.1 preprotein translocase SecG subunit [Clostridium sp. CAG:505]